MKTIDTRTRVYEDRRLILQLPESVQPGEHHIVVVIDEQPLQIKSITATKLPLKFKSFAWKAWPADCTFRREDLYDDYGR